MRKLIFPLLMVLLATTSCSENKKDSKTYESQNILWNIPEIEADDLDFGIVDENSTKLLSVQIKNGTSSVISGSPTISGDSSFSLAYSNCVNLAAGKTCSIKLVFKPLDNTSSTRTANITYGEYSNLMIGSVNVFNNEDIQFLNGSTPINSLNLGSLNYNQGLIKSITIKNQGDIDSNYPVLLSGTSFRIIYDQCSNKVIKPQKKCLLKLHVTGQGLSGLVEDTLSYGSQELSVQLQVKNFEVTSQDSDIKSFYQQLAIDSILNLETINLRDDKIINISYKNVGTEAGIFNSVSYDHSIFHDTCSSKVLSPNASCLIKVGIPAQTTGVFSHSLNATINGVISSKLIQYQVRESGDRLTCANQIPFADVAFITWTGSVWTNCVVEQCHPHYTLANNECNYIIPSANDINLTVAEDNGSGELDFDFSTINGNATAEIMSQPTNGTVALNGNKFTYNPTSNYHGSDSFTYRIFDGHSYSAVKTVYFTVNPVNDAPVASNQSFSTDEDVNLPLLLNYSDIDGDSLTYTLVSGPSKGTLTGTAPNLIYVPSLNLNGSDSFTYKVNDGNLDSNVVTVSININPINDAPVLATSSTLSTNINSPSNAASFTVTDVDSTAFTYQITQQGTKGVLSVNGVNNSLIYTPNSNQYGADSVSFRAFDGTSYSNTVTISITINGSGIILTADGSRTYFDGTTQKNCYDYRNTNSGNKTYTGSTGDGVYKIQSGSEIVNVYCDQTTDGGGWTLAVKVGDYGGVGSYTGLTTGTNALAGLTTTNVNGIGVTYSKLSNAMINNIRSTTSSTSAAYRVEKVNGNFNASYKKLFYPGACTFAQYGSNIASVAPWCTRRAETWNATSFASGPSGPGWCDQANVMYRHWFCSATHEAFTIVVNYEGSENHNIPHHRIWVR